MEKQQITLYYYEPQTNLFIVSGNADFCPKTGEPLIPWNAVLIAPPAYKDGECAILNDDLSDWIVKIDNRGVWYDKITQEKIIINSVDQDISGLTKLSPLPYSKWNEKLNCWEVDEAEEQKEKEEEREKTIIEEAIYQLKNTAYLGLPHILETFSLEDQSLIKDYHVALYLIIRDSKQGTYPEKLPILNIDI